jgi:hypothetical protein
VKLFSDYADDATRRGAESPDLFSLTLATRSTGRVGEAGVVILLPTKTFPNRRPRWKMALAVLLGRKLYAMIDDTSTRLMATKVGMTYASTEETQQHG